MLRQTKTPVGAGAASRAWEGERHGKSSTALRPLSTGRPVYLNNRHAGYVFNVDGVRVFQRLFDSRAHILRRLHSLAFHREIVNELKADAVEWIHCVDETGAEHWATLEELQRYGIPINDPRHGAQLALNLKHFTPRPERQTRLL